LIAELSRYCDAWKKVLWLLLTNLRPPIPGCGNGERRRHWRGQPATTSGKVVIELDTGLEVRFRPQDAQGLATATADELAEIEISPSGLGIHFPIIDADLYIPALLQGFLGSRAWASAMGRAGGATSTEAKAAAARANGRLGGRPRKTVKRAAIKVI
jgi:hypothetical protein